MTPNEIHTSIAVIAFREVERVKLLLDRKQYALEQALKKPIDMDVYFEKTEKIRKEFDVKREQLKL